MVDGTVLGGGVAFRVRRRNRDGPSMSAALLLTEEDVDRGGVVDLRL